ncbi:MAG: hypothetical protein J6Y21_00145, partial [Clostridia bacterium]|nr:hypothetical protein [Clostridia bacterium]
MNIKKKRLLALTLAALLAISFSGCIKTPGGNELIVINTPADNIVTGIDVTGAASVTPTPETTAAATAVTTVLPTDGPAAETTAPSTVTPVETDTAPTSTGEQAPTATAADAPTATAADAPTATA